MGAPSEVYFHTSIINVVDVPPWPAILVLPAYVAVAVIAGVATRHATRRKGPPPLPHP